MLLYRRSTLIYYLLAFIHLSKGNATISYGNNTDSFQEHPSSSFSPLDTGKVKSEGINCRIAATLTCTDGVRSCRNRCGHSISGEQIRQFYCQCDHLCSHFEDCCYDYRELCLHVSDSYDDENVTRIVDESSLNRTKGDGVTQNTPRVNDNVTANTKMPIDSVIHDPVKTNADSLNSTIASGALNTPRMKNNHSNNDSMRSLYSCVLVRGYISVYLRSKCHKDFKGTEMERKCRSQRGNELLNYIPSYDQMTQQHYINIFCARCNYVQAPVVWKIQIICEIGFMKINYLETFDVDTILDFLKNRLCHMEYFEPNGSILPRPCIDTLYGTGETCPNETVAEKCAKYGLNPVYDFFMVYHNIYCWQSRQWHDFPYLKEGHSSLCYINFHNKAGRNVPINTQFYSLDILIDTVNENGWNIFINPMDNHTSYLGDGVWTCNGRAECKITSCPLGFQKTGNKCRFQKMLINVTIWVHFEYESHYNMKNNLISASYLISHVMGSFGPAWPDLSNFYTGKILYNLYVPLGDGTGILDNITKLMDMKLQNLQTLLNKSFGKHVISTRMTYTLPSIERDSIRGTFEPVNMFNTQQYLEPSNTLLLVSGIITIIQILRS